MNANAAPIRNELSKAHEQARRTLQHASALEIVLDAQSRRPVTMISTYAENAIHEDLVGLRDGLAALLAALAPYMRVSDIQLAALAAADDELVREPAEEEV